MTSSPPAAHGFSLRTKADDIKAHPTVPMVQPLAQHVARRPGVKVVAAPAAPAPVIHMSCGCGRLVPTTMHYAVADLPVEQRVAAGWAADTSYVCDGCLSGAVRAGSVLHSDLLTVQDAPAAVIADVREREVAASMHHPAIAKAIAARRAAGKY